MARPSNTEPKAFKFKKFDKVGEAAAEDDGVLSDCFVETQDLAEALRIDGPKSLIVGNTGSGKSALLRAVRQKYASTSIVVGPEALAFSYITNSSIIKWLRERDIRLDPFFKLLWRHVFVVEVIKARYKIRTEADKSTFLERVAALFNENAATKVRAIEYLNKWGKQFWQDTDVRVKEVLTTLENRVTSESGLSVGEGTLSGKDQSFDSLKEETRKEYTERAQRVIHDPLLGLLEEVIGSLDVMMEGDPHPYYLLVDGLDDDWVDDSLKYPMLRALVETVRSFRHLTKVKILVGLRRDLLERMFAMARDPGFQEEKYEALQLRINWTVDDLITLLDKRTNKLVCSRYAPTTPVTAESVFKDGKKSLGYIIERSRMRPRDVIQYMNYCIDGSVEQEKIPHERVLEAEQDYSQSRLKALFDEWAGTFPNLPGLIEITKRKVYPHSVRDMRMDEAAESLLLEIAAGPGVDDEIKFHAHAYVSESSDDLKRKHFIQLLLILHRVGLIALKADGRRDFVWAQEQRHAYPGTDLTDTAKVRVHRCFNKALAVTDRKQS